MYFHRWSILDPELKHLKANCQTNTPCGTRNPRGTIPSNHLEVIFISCKPPVEPVELVLKYLDIIRETGITQTRYRSVLPGFYL